MRVQGGPRERAATQATLSHYRVLEQIGQGGMGAVYRAHDEHLDCDVALKVLPAGELADDAARKRFRKEALALSKVHHPNIAVVHDFDTQNGTDFLVEELIPGLSLNEMLISGPLPEREIVNLGSQLCEGLAAAHDQGVIHRDLKPGNIRVTPDARVKILDFGLAKVLRSTAGGASDDVTASVTETQTVSGTLPYMAPEQLLNEKLDARADIWSLGCVLYEMATGRRPFLGSGAALTDAILHQPVPAIGKLNPKISGALEAVIQKCLDRDVEERYCSAREITVDLRRAQSGMAIPVRRESRTKRAAWILGVLVFTVGLLIALNIGDLRERMLGLLGAPRIRSIAVLPVKNFSGDPAQEFFADGMTDALISGLAEIKAIKVISRTSAMHYKGTNETLPRIARELGVDGVVEASVMRSQGRVHVRVQLVDARQDRNLWAATYERELTDVLALQSELVRAVAGEIRVRVTPREGERLKATRRVDPEVYDNTLRGKAMLEYATREEEFRRAIHLFQMAIDKDPTYAPAWAGLGDAQWMLAATGLEFVAPAQVRAQAIAAAEKALELDENLPEAHVARANIAGDAEWDFASAQRHYRRALELRPGYAAARSSYALLLMEPLRRFDDARRQLDLARELDPLNPWNDIILVGWWRTQGELQKAIEAGQQVRQRNPTLWLIPWQMGAARLQLGQPKEAAGDFEEALKLLHPERPASVLGPLGLARGLAGDRNEALRILAELRQVPKKSYVSPFYVAMVYSGLGQMDEAFSLLDRALTERIPPLAYCEFTPLPVVLQRDPRWTPFRNRLLQLVRLPSGTPDSTPSDRERAR